MEKNSQINKYMNKKQEYVNNRNYFKSPKGAKVESIKKQINNKNISEHENVNKNKFDENIKHKIEEAREENERIDYYIEKESLTKNIKIVDVQQFEEIKQDIEEYEQGYKNWLKNAKQGKKVKDNSNIMTAQIQILNNAIMQDFKEDIINEIIREKEKEQMKMKVFIKSKGWAQRNVRLDEIKEVIKIKLPAWYISETKNMIIFRDRTLEENYKLEEQQEQIQNILTLSPQNTQCKIIIIKQEQLKDLKITEIKQRKITQINEWVILYDDDHVKEIMADKIVIEIKDIPKIKDTVWFRRLNRNKIMASLIINAMDQYGKKTEETSQIIEERIIFANQLLNVNKIQISKKISNVYEGFIQGEVISKLFLGASKVQLWSALVPFYKAKRRESFYATSIDKNIWFQIKEYFKGTFSKYREFTMSLEKLDYKFNSWFITKDEWNIPKSNALDIQGIDARMMVKELRKHISFLPQKSQMTNIMIGPVAAKMMIQMGAKNLARTFYFLKKDDEIINDMKQVRILYILPAFIRVYESTVTNVIMKLIAITVNKNETLNFASIKGLGAQQMIKRIREIYQQEENAIIIQLDLSRAFDSVRHEILEEAIEFYYGNQTTEYGYNNPVVIIRELMKQWIKIINQMGTWNYSDSKIIYKQIGLPMGSALSPIMFVLYISYCLKDYEYTRLSYSDDTYLILQPRVAIIDDALKKLKEKLDKGGMKLNIEKSKMIISSAVRSPDLEIIKNKYKMTIQSDLDILGITLSMVKWSQTRNATCKIEGLRQIIDTSLGFVIVNFIINNAIISPALYRARMTKNLDEEIVTIISYIFQKYNARWKWFRVTHLFMVIPALIFAMSTGDLVDDDKEKRKNAIRKITEYKSFFKGKNKEEFIEVIINIEKQFQNEKKQRQQKINMKEVERFLEAKRVLCAEFTKQQAIEELYGEEPDGGVVWRNIMAKNIKRLNIKKSLADLLAADILKNISKPIWYIWLIKVIEKDTRTSKDNFILNMMAQTVKQIREDDDEKHAKEILTEIQSNDKWIISDKEKKKFLKEYLSELREVDQEQAWFFHLWNKKIEEIISKSNNFKPVTEKDEIIIIETYMRITRKKKNNNRSEKKTAQKKFLKVIAVVFDEIISLHEQNKWNKEQIQKEIIDRIRNLTKKENFLDYRRYVIMNENLEDIIGMHIID